MDYWEYTNFAERFNIALLRRLADESIHLAPPTQALRIITPRARTNGNGHSNRLAAPYGVEEHS